MKRGTIPLHRISLCFNRKEFEYDVYSLVRAFDPAGEIVSWYAWEERPDGEFAYYDTVRYEDDRVIFSIADASGNVTAFGEAAADLVRDRAGAKNALKKLVYRLLSETTGVRLPWGNLTGIRPTKIPMKLLEEGREREDIVRFMRDTYDASEPKARLALKIAERERAILAGMEPERGYSLYIGIPFCPSICLYCSFGSHPLSRWAGSVDSYLDALIRELDFIRESMSGYRLDTIYIGGGTPTTLSPAQMERLLAAVEERFPAESVREFTVEAGRPDTIHRPILAVLRAHPVTRISVNPQTMNQETLDLIGRKHTVGDTVRAFALAREMGFDNINMDLIVGLPGEGEREVARTLSEIEKLSPDSLTVHSLALKRATRLHLFREEYREISFENSSAIMDRAAESARAMGMEPYYLYRQKNMAGNFENVGYARPGRACLYNILIMEEKQSILAAGAGASTKFVYARGGRVERAENVKDLTQYLDRVEEMIGRKRRGIGAWMSDCRE